MWSSLHLTKLLFILGFPAENQGAFSSDPLLDVRMREQHCWKHWKKLILSMLILITYLKHTLNVEYCLKSSVRELPQNIYLRHCLKESGGTAGVFYQSQMKLVT